MAYNDFTGDRILAPTGIFQTPSEKAMAFLNPNRGKAELYLGCDLGKTQMILWGDEAGLLNNFVASTNKNILVPKLKNFEKDLASHILIVPDVFDEYALGGILNNHSGRGLKLNYDRSMTGDIQAITINGIKSVKISITSPPGPAADWVETFTYIIIAKAEINNLNVFLNDLQNSHKKAPTFHTIGARGNSENTDVEPYSWDQVILDPVVVKLLKDDFESFFKREEWFKSKRLPFRRGYLLHGDPGNGKTSAIKAMMWAKGMDAFTLSFFDKNVGLAELNNVFESAAERRPSMVVLEDIDRAFPKKDSKCSINLQELLNVIDGIGTKEGIITVATANNPADLDPAILKRPGRFDRTIKFENPNQDLRVKYFLSKDPDIDQDENFRKAIDLSDGYSFAQLQESYIMAGQHAYDAEMSEITGSQLLKAVEALRSGNKGVTKLNTVGFS